MPFAALAARATPFTVHYTDSGDRGLPAVVLIHGTGGDLTNWDLLTPRLAATHRVLAVDLAGSGRTPSSDGPVTLDDLVAQVVAVLDDAGVERCGIVGHSLGAVVAARLAALHPDRADALALQAGWVRTTTEMAANFEHWKRLLSAGGTGLLAECLFLQAFDATYWDHAGHETHRSTVEQFAASLAPGIEQLIDVDLDVDLRADLPAITARTVLVQSADDRIIPAAQRRALEHALPHASVITLPAGHAAPATSPDRFAEEILAFLHAGTA